MKELEKFLSEWAFINGSIIAIAELIDGYIYLYGPYMLDNGQLTRRNISKLSLDSTNVSIMSENGYTPVCKRQELSKLLGGIL